MYIYFCNRINEKKRNKKNVLSLKCLEGFVSLSLASFNVKSIFDEILGNILSEL